MKLLLWLLASSIVQGDPERARAELEAGRYGNAWAESAALADSLQRGRLQSAILFRAGDQAGALAAAEQGLALAPSDLELLQRAAAAAIWLGDPSTARELVRRLDQALPGLELEPDALAAWEREARDLSRWTEELQAHDDARRGVLLRGRVVAVTLLVGALGVLVWFGSRTLSLRG